MKRKVVSSSDDDDDVDDLESSDDSGGDDDVSSVDCLSLSSDDDDDAPNQLKNAFYVVKKAWKSLSSLSSDDDDDASNQLKNAFYVVKKAWKSVSPPNIYISRYSRQMVWCYLQRGKFPMLHVAKVLMRKLYVDGLFPFSRHHLWPQKLVIIVRML